MYYVGTYYVADITPAALTLCDRRSLGPARTQGAARDAPGAQCQSGAGSCSIPHQQRMRSMSHSRTLKVARRRNDDRLPGAARCPRLRCKHHRVLLLQHLSWILGRFGLQRP